MITSDFAKRIFKDALERYGTLDAALTQVVAVAYRAGHADAGGQVIYTDGWTDSVIKYHPNFEQHVGRCNRKARDFEHFLSYSGLSAEDECTLAKMKRAFKAGHG